MKRITLFTAVCLGTSAIRADTVHLQRLVATGDTVAGLVVTDLRQVSQNESGEIVVAGESSAFNDTIWAGHPGFLEVVVRNGQSGADGGAFANVSGSALVVPVINDEGEVAFLASEGGTGMYTWTGGAIGKVARHGDPVPGLPGATFAMNFGYVTRPFFSRSGSFQFLTRMDGSTTSADDYALWGGVSGQPQMIAREGSGIPGLPGLFFPSISFIYEAATANSAGITALCTSLGGAGVATNTNDNAVLVGGAGGFSVVMRGGDAAVAPGLPPDATFEGVWDNWPARINDLGEVLFFATLKGTGVSGTLNTGNHLSLWKGFPGALKMIARRADPAPGLAGVTLLLSTSLVPDLELITCAGNGDAAFVSRLAGDVTTGTDTALFAHLAGTNLLVAREGDQAPGLPAGVVFNQIDAFQGWRFAINSAGRMAVLADLAGTGVTNANDAALFFWSPVDGLQLIAREGGSVEIAPGVFQTITGVGFNGTHGDDSGSPRNFNSRDQLAFVASLDGDPAILRASLVSPAAYELETTTTHSSGGGNSASVDYRVDTETTATVGQAEGGVYLAKMDFVGQLYDVTGLSAAAAPSPADENSSIQLAASAVLDDDTTLVLPAGEAQWAVLSGPLLSIDPDTDLALTGVVHLSTLASASVRFDSYLSTVSVLVLNSDIDNFSEYGGDGIDDSWQIRHFGPPPNSDALPGSNPDFDDQDNLFEYLAGTDPGDPSSFFSIRLEMTGPTAAAITLNKVIPGTRYRLLRTSSLDTPPPWPELTNFTVEDEASDFVVEDPAAPPLRSFYRVKLEKP